MRRVTLKSLGLIVAALFAVAITSSIALAAITTTIDPANAPSGTHLQTGAIGCTVASNNLDVSCTLFELAGVGHTNAVVTLTATYTADVTCSNKGVNPQNAVEAQGATFTDSTSTPLTSSKNGRLTVPAQSASFPGTTSSPCPNGNWTATFTNKTLQSFTYTLTFDGFSAAYITITGP
jgi:hypothetical protein